MFSPKDKIDGLQKFLSELKVELEEKETRNHEESLIFFEQSEVSSSMLTLPMKE